MNMQEQIAAVEAELGAAVAPTPDAVEAFRIGMLGKNGKVTALLDAFKNVPPEEKRLWGQRLNQLKQAARSRWEELKAAAEAGPASADDAVDATRPVLTAHAGSLHPISIVRQRIINVFGHIGFTVSQGPEVEDDRHNFGALNFPPDVFHDPQLIENGYVVDIEHPLFGTYKTFGPPLRMDATPTRIRSAAPQLDQHTEEVMGELGFGESERRQLRSAGITGVEGATSA